MKLKAISPCGWEGKMTEDPNQAIREGMEHEKTCPIDLALEKVMREKGVRLWVKT